MENLEDRSYLLEAYAILGGMSRLLPEVNHLKALAEETACTKIKLAHQLRGMAEDLLK